MKKKLLFWVIIFLSAIPNLHSQLKGSVTNAKGERLAFVNIYLDETIKGTTTNDNGLYELELESTGTYTIVYKYIGYKTKKTTITVDQLPYVFNVVLEEESLLLNEVSITASENPANRIILNAIQNRKKQFNKIKNHTIDFYSKGLIKIKDAPQKILGQNLGDFGGGLDSTRSGIIYLSETISKVESNNTQFKEKIIASKVSGEENGFSFNNASDVNFSFYKNTVEFGSKLISPIAKNAFNYYKYKLKGTFYDDNKNLINQIEVIPKRSNDKVFKGTIYIVEDDWSLYAVDLKVTGQQTQITAVDTVFIKQDFIYSKKNNTWLKVLQSIDFQYKIFKFKGDGRFTAAYKNYDLNPTFTKKDFTNEVLSFESNANKKDSIYWHQLRSVPLTQNEARDYKIKDSLQIIRKSQKYLDSVDKVRNKFKVSSLVFGYRHNNTFKEKYHTISSPILESYFNTVQGFHGSLSFDFLKLNKDNGTRFNFNVGANYGFSEKRFRPHTSVSYHFNNFSRPYIEFSAGSKATQFNDDKPITPISNTITTLLFENNFAKFYENNFLRVFYSQEITNGIYIDASLNYENRQPLFNTSDFVLIDDANDNLSSNNPIAPEDFENAVITEHDIFRLAVTGKIRFGQKYLSYPDGKFSFSEDRYPILQVTFEKGFASSNATNNFNQFKIKLYQSFDIANLGRFGYNLRSGTFLNNNAISFVDFQHFNGNRTKVIRGNYLETFILLPYYDLSTNQSYFESHLEHNFKGYIMRNIPLLNKLNSELILTSNLLSTSSNKPYSEFGIALGNLGPKKFKFLRVGYVQSYFDNKTERGLNIGIQF